MAIPKTPLLTTDCVIFDGNARVLLIRRKNEPFKGEYALPGGFIDVGETTEAACRREVREEVGLELSRLDLVGVYSDPKRDPRGHAVSVVYMTRFAEAPEPQAGDDAEAAEWVADWRTKKLAFDHALVIADAEKMSSP
jgi:8-oxo-dGTP diphosphatase